MYVASIVYGPWIFPIVTGLFVNGDINYYELSLSICNDGIVSK